MDLIGPICFGVGVLMLGWIVGGWLGLAVALCFIGFCTT